MGNKSLFLVCTETSGDLLGARLVEELAELRSDFRVAGVGGDRLAGLGMELLYHIRDFNVMGMVEVISELRRLHRQFKTLVEAVKRQRPDVILLIDAPDFNMRFAKALRHLEIPIVYYVSPQVWAWRKRRARTLAHLVDHLMLLFKFEESIYQSLGVTATWVGHPIADEVVDIEDKAEFFSQNEILENKPLVALAPGSRPAEVGRLLPVMREVALLRGDRYQFALPLAPAIDEAILDPLLQGAPIKVLPGRMRDVMAHAAAAIVASGTATLETGLLKTPMIVGYKVNAFSYFLARAMVRLPQVALVNIVLGDRVVPELMQADFATAKVLPLLDALLREGGERRRMIEQFSRLRQLLGGGGASRRAAEIVSGYLSR
jgi:lipid-A-disaccharide synthase